MELLVREVGKDVYVLACRAHGGTSEVTFSGLPNVSQKAEVMFESPRTVDIKDGGFKDWFAPFEVHVYKMTRQ